MPRKAKSPSHVVRPNSIGTRLDPEFYDRYEEAAKRLGIDKAELLRRSIIGFVAMCEANDYQIPWPVEISPSSIIVPNPALANSRPVQSRQDRPA